MNPLKNVLKGLLLLTMTVWSFSMAAQLSPYCGDVVQHLGIPAETASAIELTISNISTTEMQVTCVSADADPVDDIIIAGGSGAAISAPVACGAGMCVTLTWLTPPTDVDMNVLWSKASFGGNWQLSPGNILIPFAANCDPIPTDQTLTDITIDGASLAGFDSEVFSYDVELPNGAAYPAVVGVAADMSSTLNYTNGALPFPSSTSIEVVGAGGSSTYVINFTEAPDLDNSAYCGDPVQHLGIPGETASAVNLWIANYGSNALIVIIESADADPVDDLIIPGGSGASIGDIDASVPGQLSRVLSWGGTPPADVVLNVLWSKASFGGNWQLSPGDITVPFTAACDGIVPPPAAPLTLTVDACGATPTEVRMTGFFWGWDPVGGPIASDNGDGTWSVVLDPAPTENMEYLWVFDGVQENLIDDMQNGGACAPVTDFANYANRLWNVGGADPSDVYDTCNACGGGGPLTLTVDACGATPTEVRMTGFFWGWDPVGGPIASDNGDGTWSVVLDPAPTENMEYLWVFDGVQENLIDDMQGGASCAPVTDFANFANRLWNVGDGDEFDTYDTCTPCNPSLDPITLTVDVCDATPTEVRMTGFFWGWDPAGGPIATDNGDGTWSVTLDPAPTADMEYLWVIDGVVENLIDDMQNGATCAPITDFANYANRLWEVGDPDQNDVYDTCDACGGGVTPLTLTVDACGASPTEVRMTGFFWGWDPVGGPVASDNGDGTWSVVLDPAPTENMEYLWVFDGVQENLIDDMQNGGSCAPVTDFANYANRLWIVGDPDQNDVYDTCDPCAGGSGITLTVDVSCSANPTPTEVRLTGFFWGWDPVGGPIASDNGDGTWSVVLDPAPTETMEYLWVVDGVQENLIDDMQNGGSCAPVTDFANFANRQWLVGDGDEFDTYDTCTPCNPSLDPITLTVDVSCSGTTPTEVRMTGFFWGWDPAGGPIATDNGDGTWSVTLDPAPTADMEYLWIIDGVVENLIDDMQNGATCAPITDFANYANRLWEVGDPDQNDTYGQCEACSAMAGCTDPNAVNYDAAAMSDDGSCTYNVTVSVDMNQYGMFATTVNVFGQFNGWDPGANPLDDSDMDGVWEGTVVMPNGDQEYKFILGDSSDEEMFAGGESCTVTNDGFTNRVINVAGNTTVPTVCWESCAACPAAFYDVAFRVDMAQQVVDAAGVHISADFQGFDPAATPMTYMGYGIYEFTVSLASGSTVSYEYVNGDNAAGEEMVPMECGTDDGNGGYYRSYTVGNADAIVLVCFNECDACAGCTDPLSLEYNPFAGMDDGSCATGLVYGCTYVDADNYDASANVDDNSCTFTTGSACPEDLDSNGVVNAADLLAFLTAFGTVCE